MSSATEHRNPEEATPTTPLPERPQGGGPTPVTTPVVEADGFGPWMIAGKSNRVQSAKKQQSRGPLPRKRDIQKSEKKDTRGYFSRFEALADVEDEVVDLSTQRVGEEASDDGYRGQMVLQRGKKAAGGLIGGIRLSERRVNLKDSQKKRKGREAPGKENWDPSIGTASAHGGGADPEASGPHGPAHKGSKKGSEPIYRERVHQVVQGGIVPGGPVLTKAGPGPRSNSSDGPVATAQTHTAVKGGEANTAHVRPPSLEVDDMTARRGQDSNMVVEATPRGRRFPLRRSGDRVTELRGGRQTCKPFLLAIFGVINNSLILELPWCGA